MTAAAAAVLHLPAGDADQDIVELLAHRYGDGLVYTDDERDRRLLERAARLGLVSGDGYLTRAGRRFLARHRLD